MTHPAMLQVAPRRSRPAAALPDQQPGRGPVAGRSYAPAPAMAFELTTSWDLIHGAAEGDAKARDQFAQQYLPVASAYLRSRWRGTKLEADVEDACQEVFLECLGSQTLQRANPAHGDFRGYLHGIVRHVALRFERERGGAKMATLELGSAAEWVVADDTAASKVFDREWARTILKLALQDFRYQAAADPERARRVELLRLRFEENLPIREIAAQWHCEAAWLHHEYARARRDFKGSLAKALDLGADEPERLTAEVERLWQALV